jgi:hypothetical protein
MWDVTAIEMRISALASAGIITTRDTECTATEQTVSERVRHGAPHERTGRASDRLEMRSRYRQHSCVEEREERHCAQLQLQLSQLFSTFLAIDTN